jgi:hypothetical protein
VARSGARAHPGDLGVSRSVFVDCLLGLAAYTRAEGLDVGVADLQPIMPQHAADAWEFVNNLPRAGSD